MIEIKNCKKIELNLLKHDIDGFRTIEKSAFNRDELFKSNNEEVLILCHTITEGSNGAYYFQQVIFMNNEEQNILINLSNFWSPLWTRNFKFDSETKTYLTSITCYDKKSNSNPLPQLIISINKRTILMKNKDVKIDLCKEIESEADWIQWDENLNICETYRDKYDM